MWKRRILCLMLASALASTVAMAAEGERLFPKIKDSPAFTDTVGIWCEDAVKTVCETDLMVGVDAKHFMAGNGLNFSQIIAVSARMHRLLSGGTLDMFYTDTPGDPDWWKLYDAYLREQIPALAEDPDYQNMCENPRSGCDRERFFGMLAAVIQDTGTVLPKINDVNAVPDCNDPDIMLFYQTGILSGKDDYGTLHGSDPLSRGAAAATLARLIDPAQRMKLNLQTLELCQELLGVEPETILMSVDGQDITAEQFIPLLVSAFSEYNRSHFYSMTLEGWEGGPALQKLREYVRCETLAKELGITLPEDNTTYYDGYQGFTAKGQAWNASHAALLRRVKETLHTTGTLTDLPEIQYAELWESLPFDEALIRTGALPVWGGFWGGV